MAARKSKPTPETPVKATDAEVTQRVATIHKLMVAGASRASIVQYGSKTWQITDRQVDDYIARAKKGITDQANKDKNHNLALALERMSDIYQQCYAAKNYKGAVSAQQEINRLLGLYAPTKTEMTGDGGGPLQIKFVRDSGFNPTPAITNDPDDDL